MAAAHRDAAMPEFAMARPRRLAPLGARNDVASAVPSNGRTTAIYEAGSVARRTIDWQPPTVSPNAILGSLGTIRDRSRASTRNDGYGKAAITKLVTNLIGTGIKPLSQADDPAFRRQVQALWLRWTDESDADGLLDFYGQQALATRGWLEGGEMFARLRLRLPKDGLSVPLQVQLIEPELCPHTYNGFAANGNRIRAGIEFNGIGARVAYYFHPSRPDLDDFDASELRRVPADSVIHFYDPLRAVQLRGLPHLTQALVTLLMLDKTADAALLKQQIANLFALFVTRDAPTPEAADYDPLTGLAKSTDGEPPALQLEPGLVQELFPGEDVKFSEPPEPGTGLPEFMKFMLRKVAVSVDVPYEVLTGDMSGMNDRTVRVVLNEFKRRMQMVQHAIVAFKFCRPIWSAWMYRAFLSGALPIPPSYLDDPAPWATVKWMPPRWAYLHPVQDVEADKEAIRAGFTSRSAVVSEYGEDAEQIDEEQAADNTRADGLKLKYSSDGRNPTSGAAQQPSLFDEEPAAAGATS